MRLQDIKIDADAFENGSWVGNIPDMGDLRLKVRAFGSRAHREREAHLAGRGNLGKDAAEVIHLRLLHETILLEWENVTDEKGRPIVYTPEEAKRLLEDPELRFFRLAVEYAARQVARPPALADLAL